MKNRWMLAGLALLFLVSCGGGGNEPQYSGIESKGTKPPEASEDGKKIQARLEKVEGQSYQATKDEAPPVPSSTKFFVNTEAYEGTGYLPASLKQEVKEEDVAGLVPYIKVTYWENRPEVGLIFDSFNNNTNRIQYRWDSAFNVTGAEYQNRAGAMLKMYVYCPRGENKLDVHELDSFRIHKAYTMRVELTDTSISFKYVDGHDKLGGLPIWPSCEDVQENTDAAVDYESPWGTHKMEFLFSEKGELLQSARYNLEGKLDSDYTGIAKRELKWDENGQLIEEKVFNGDELISFVVFEREQGLLTARKILDKEGKPQADYLGVATYRYSYDKKKLKIEEKQLDVNDQLLLDKKFVYNKKRHLTDEIFLDKDGKVLSTYISEYDKRGLRTSYSVYSGTREEGSLTLDQNGVAVYRWTFNKDGLLLSETHHGLDQVQVEGGTELVLKNDLSGVARIDYKMNDKDELQGRVESSVNAEGKVVKETNYDANGTLTSVKRFQLVDGRMISGVESMFARGEELPYELRTLDAAGATTSVEKIEYGPGGVVMSRAFFAADGETKAAGEYNAHVIANVYDSIGQLVQTTWTDANGVTLVTLTNTFNDDGTLAKTTKVDASGKPVE